MSATHGLNPTEAAAYLTAIGVPAHQDTVRRWARDGRIRGLRTPGGWWKFSTDDLDAFAASLVREASA